ncbi:MAG TPA: hypothetical protein VFQ67_04815 [Allosphingosinicella sp.]|jgi:hypothetical protein|nr:hypothetical protein [Allosphingosinicella sp.]
MSDPFSDLFSALPSMDDVRRWEEECARIDAVMKDMAARRQRFGKMVQLAKELLDPEAQPSTLDEGEEAEEAERDLPSPKITRNRGKQSWRTAVGVIVRANPEGITYDNIKEQAPPHLKQQLERFPDGKGFYSALRRLEQDGHIVRHNGMAFTKKGYAKYKAKVEAGEAVVVTPRRASPMAGAIKQYLSEHGPATGAAIQAYLIRFPEFAGPVLKNNSAMYNVLLRLKARNEILHDGEAGTYSLAQDNGASTKADAPEAGRVAALPFENVVGFPRSR